MAEMLYGLLLAVTWGPISYALRRGEKGKKGKYAHASVILGVMAALLTAALTLLWLGLLRDLFERAGRGGGAGVLPMVFLIGFFCIPFVVAAAVAVAAGLVLAVAALAGKRRRADAPLALLGLLLNAGALALAVAVMNRVFG